MTYFSLSKTIEKTQLSVYKLVSVTTDGAPAMVGHVKGSTARCRQDDAFPDASLLELPLYNPPTSVMR